MSKKDQETLNKDRLLELMQEFCISKSFEEEFERFAKDNYDIFSKALDFDPNSDEHPLEFHEVYKMYLSKFEGLIETFLEKNGYSPGDFYDTCKDILDNDEVFGSKRFFIETMLATSEYHNFFMLMKAEMREIKRVRSHK